MTLIIAGDRSGVGKTTINLALLSFLVQKGYKVQSFKVGPDYIDPMFHTKITGRPCRNLDPILTCETYVKSCFNQHSQGVDYSLIEGVMGLFDGVPFQKADVWPNLQLHKEKDCLFNHYGSTAHIARLLNIPVLLVIDCSRLSGSVAAIAQGYRSLDPNINIIGVILNRVASDRHLELLENALTPLNLPILGQLYRQDSLIIPDRHLGLVPTDELPEFNHLVHQLADLAQTSFNWDLLFPLLTPSLHHPLTPSPHYSITSSIKIAIARDRAFNFYYPENLEILEKLGAELLYWSPLEDESLPEGTRGLYFGGGFPEVFAQELSANKKALQAVQIAIKQGMPTYAECGGLMYLCQEIINFQGEVWPMVAILPTTAKMNNRLTLGYRQAIATENNLLLTSGDTVWGHEFHRSGLTFNSPKPLFKLHSWHSPTVCDAEGWQLYNVHASYLHLHFGGCPTIPQKILRQCLDFSKSVELS